MKNKETIASGRLVLLVMASSVERVSLRLIALPKIVYLIEIKRVAAGTGSSKHLLTASLLSHSFEKFKPLK